LYYATSKVWINVAEIEKNDSLIHATRLVEGSHADYPNVNEVGWMNFRGADDWLGDEDSISLQILEAVAMKNTLNVLSFGVMAFLPSAGRSDPGRVHGPVGTWFGIAGAGDGATGGLFVRERAPNPIGPSSLSDSTRRRS
jgi:hypothetical protein